MCSSFVSKSNFNTWISLGFTGEHAAEFFLGFPTGVVDLRRFVDIFLMKWSLINVTRLKNQRKTPTILIDILHS